MYRLVNKEPSYLSKKSNWKFRINFREKATENISEFVKLCSNKNVFPNLKKKGIISIWTR